ncbi:hypothetical protein B0O99DRAFT_603293, partial [Bisporella sp. PMI_857]
MLAKTHDEFHRQSLRYHWPEKFKRRRIFDRPAENQPYIEFLRTPRFDGEEDEVDASSDEDDDNVSSELEDEVKGNRGKNESMDGNRNGDKDAAGCNGQSIVRLFMAGMTGDEENLQYPDQVEQVASFYEQGNFGKWDAKTSQHKKTVALLDDRNICGTIHVNQGSFQCTGHCRPHLGPLTSEGLYKELEKKCWHIKNCDLTNASSFVAGLDPLTIEVLTRTASRSQAPALRDLLYKHLTSKTSIGVTIPPQGFLVFTLDFHIPYYALRVSKELLKDTRQRPDGKPLRGSRKLPSSSRPLNASTSTDGAYCLYEAEVSVAVTGIDHWVWTAYGFVDTYFEPKENVDSYHHQLGGSAGPGRADPLAAGRLDADKPIWTPREYFFKVLEIRMNQVLREWNGIFLWAEKEVKQSRTHHLFPLPSSDHKIGQVRELCVWNSQMVNILRDLIDRLSDTVGAWDEFWRNEIGFFQDDDEPSTSSQWLKSSIAAVSKAVSTLNALLPKLKDLEKKLCKDSPQGLNAHLIIENHAAAMFQQRTGRHIQVLTVVTI